MPKWDKCLNVNGHYMEVWCVPSVTMCHAYIKVGIQVTPSECYSTAYFRAIHKFLNTEIHGIWWLLWFKDQRNIYMQYCISKHKMEIWTKRGCSLPHNNKYYPSSALTKICEQPNVHNKAYLIPQGDMLLCEQPTVHNKTYPTPQGDMLLQKLH